MNLKINTSPKSMVIGTGLIAQIFAKYSGQDDVVIFASGVSNSGEQMPVEFEREINLLQEIINGLDRDQLLIYFSTCSVYDATLSNSPYILHKRKIEKLISSTVQNYLVIRLPNVLGTSGNRHTLINFLLNSILNHTSFTLQRNAYRYLLGMEDVREIVSKIIDERLYRNDIINVTVYPAIPVPGIVKQIEKMTGRKALYTESTLGNYYEVPLPKDAFWISRYKDMDSETYMDQLLQKYYSDEKRNG